MDHLLLVKGKYRDVDADPAQSEHDATLPKHKRQHIFLPTKQSIFGFSKKFSKY